VSSSKIISYDNALDILSDADSMQKVVESFPNVGQGVYVILNELDQRMMLVLGRESLMYPVA
jgi:hypothetical protein